MPIEMLWIAGVMLAAILTLVIALLSGEGSRPAPKRSFPILTSGTPRE
jgi:hypothetical protein